MAIAVAFQLVQRLLREINPVVVVVVVIVVVVVRCGCLREVKWRP